MSVKFGRNKAGRETYGGCAPHRPHTLVPSHARRPARYCGLDALARPYLILSVCVYGFMEARCVHASQRGRDERASGRTAMKLRVASNFQTRPIDARVRCGVGNVQQKCLSINCKRNGAGRTTYPGFASRAAPLRAHLPLRGPAVSAACKCSCERTSACTCARLRAPWIWDVSAEVERIFRRHIRRTPMRSRFLSILRRPNFELGRWVDVRYVRCERLDTMRRRERDIRRGCGHSCPPGVARIGDFEGQ